MIRKANATLLLKLLSKKKKAFLELFYRIVYPNRCVVCGEVIGWNSKYAHKECEDKLPLITLPYCQKCGSKLYEDDLYCYKCKESKHYYDKGRALYVRTKETKLMIYRQKYDGKRDIARFYGAQIYKHLISDIKAWQIDSIIPVPIHKNRLKQRGFNQAEDIAMCLRQEIFSHLNFKIPIYNDLIIRYKETVAQKNLGQTARIENMKKAFKITGDASHLNNVLIIDDLYTTGSTIDAMSKLLKENGAKKVYFISVLIGEVV